jgi:hypothetical protein
MGGKWGKAYWMDLGERVGSTFLATLIPMYVTAQNVTAINWPDTLIVSGSAAGLSLLKGLYANLRSTAGTASIVGVTSNQEVETTPVAIGSDDTEMSRTLAPVESDAVTEAVTDNDDADDSDPTDPGLPDDAQPPDEPEETVAQSLAGLAAQGPAASAPAEQPTATPAPAPTPGNALPTLGTGA